MSTNIPSLLEFLKAGTHFGHQTSKRHPKMQPFIFTKRNGVNIIDLEQTQGKLKEALEFVAQITANGGSILFIGTKKQAHDIIKEAAIRSESPYVVERWLGGTFTNFDNISRLFKTWHSLSKDKESGEWKKYTKKETVTFDKQLTKLTTLVGGIKEMSKLPKAIFVIDVKKEKTAVAEANKKGIPVIALLDTNINPDLVQYGIPANDDAVKSIELITNLVAETIISARKAPVAEDKSKK